MDYPINDSFCGVKVRIKRKYFVYGIEIEEKENKFGLRNDIGTIIHPDTYVEPLYCYVVEFGDGTACSYHKNLLEFLTKPTQSDILLTHAFTFEDIIKKDPPWDFITKLSAECHKRNRQLNWCWWGWNYIKDFHPSMIEYKNWLNENGFIFNHDVLKENNFITELKYLFKKYNY